MQQGFGHPESDPAVDAIVRQAAERMATQGVDVSEICVPMHYDGPPIWSGIILEGAAEMMMKGHGVGNNVAGYYPLGMQEAFARGFDTRLNG